MAKLHLPIRTTYDFRTQTRQDHIFSCCKLKSVYYHVNLKHKWGGGSSYCSQRSCPATGAAQQNTPKPLQFTERPVKVNLGLGFQAWQFKISFTSISAGWWPPGEKQGGRVGEITAGSSQFNLPMFISDLPTSMTSVNTFHYKVSWTAGAWE